MAMLEQGVIIMDTDRRIRVVSPGAEDLLGWRAVDVAGLDCALVLDCRDVEGNSLCDHCSGRRALSEQELTPWAIMSLAERTGGRQTVRASFWPLPPSGAIYEHRVMAVFEPAVE
jgi:PAS domain-containing protein